MPYHSGNNATKAVRTPNVAAVKRRCFVADGGTDGNAWLSVAGFYDLMSACRKDVDSRARPGHDGVADE